MKFCIKYFFLITILLNLENKIIAHKVIEALELASLLPKSVSQPKAKIKKITCDICFQDLDESEFSLKCNHHTCKDCVREMIDLARKEKTTKALKCPFCAKKIDLDEIATATNNDPIAIKELSDIMHKEQLMAQGKVKPCPTPNCNQLHIVDKNKQRQTITCPSCNEQYCSDCFIKHSPNLTCEQVKAMHADKDKASMDWINQNTKPCPACNMSIQKTEGCNKITCTTCNKYFCWVCGFESDDNGTLYEHLHAAGHFG